MATSTLYGAVSKTANVETDDPAHPELVLTVSANVLVDLDFENPSLRFTNLVVGEETALTTAFIAKDPDAVRFADVTSSSKRVTARIVEMDDGRRGLEVKVEPELAGRLLAKIEVGLVEPEKKTLAVEVVGSVAGNIRATPGVLSIDIAPGATEAVGEIRIKSEKAAVSILSIEEPEGLLDLEIETITKGRLYLVHAKVTPAGLEKGRFTAAIVVKSTSGEQPQAEVPVRVQPLGP